MEKDEIRNDPIFNLLEIVRVRKIPVIIGFFSVFAITIVGTFLMPAVYETSAKVIVNIPVIPKDLPYLEDYRDSRSFLSDQRVVASSRVIYEKAAKDLNLDQKNEKKPSFFGRLRNAVFKKNSNPLEEAIGDLYKSTDVNLIRGTNIIRIDARSTSSQWAASIANTLAKTYTDYLNNHIFGRAKMAHDVVLREIEGVRDELSKSQNALRQLRGTDNVIADRITILRELGEYRIQYEQVQSKIHRIQYEQAEEIDNLENAISKKKAADQKKRRSEEIAMAKAPESARVKGLKSRLAKLQEELDAELRRYSEKHPDVKKLRSQIASLEKELLQEEKSVDPGPSIKRVPEKSEAEDKSATPDISVRRMKLADKDVKYLESMGDNLGKQIQTLESRLLRLSLIESDAERLRRDVNSKELDYAVLKAKLENARILKDQTQEGSVKILESAVPPSFSSNKKKVILVLVGFIASIVFGLGTGFIAEYRDNTIKTHEDAEEFLKLPVLASIPPIPQLIQKGKFWSRFGRNI